MSAEIFAAIQEVHRDAKKGRAWAEIEKALAEIAARPEADRWIRSECAVAHSILAEYYGRPREEREQIFAAAKPLIEATTFANLAAKTISFAASDPVLAQRYLPPLRAQIDEALADPEVPDREELERSRAAVDKVLARHGLK
ncbi:hypothetical protein [Haliangium ochraceum]|uniref:Uncharacterized protein n=1 Tax=Haliangium ochraceum (strain DSM 14365 / JCM 11303 / SMP-2) TaxID=502025 RepID=D0LIN9_HALO1|nr:hypothetical protein [Haliangium ochraceum]ACY18395.1 conserved hypothetical protein [Haliangium ochraceum DSM 14365]